MRRPNDDFDGEPLARFLARYSPKYSIPVDMALAMSLEWQKRPGILSGRADHEELTEGDEQ